MKTPHSLCVRLRKARLAAGLTLAQVGERAGMPLQQISAYELGVYAPGVAALERWAAALGLTLDLR